MSKSFVSENLIWFFDQNCICFYSVFLQSLYFQYKFIVWGTYQVEFIGWDLPPLLQVTSRGSTYFCHASFLCLGERRLWKIFLENKKSVKKGITSVFISFFDKVQVREGEKKNNGKKSLCEKCSNTEFFLVRILLYSVRIQENTDQEKHRKKLRHFSRSESRAIIILRWKKLLLKVSKNSTLVPPWRNIY